MKTTAMTDNFIEKLMLGSENPAIYRADRVCSYADLAAQLDSMSSDLQNAVPTPENENLVLHAKDQDSLLVAFLAVLGNWHKIVLVLGEETEENMLKLALKNDAKTIVSDTSFSKDSLLGSEALNLVTLDFTGYSSAVSKPTTPTYQVNIAPSTQLIFAGQRGNNALTVTFTEILEAFEVLDRKVLTSGGDSYLLYGELELWPMILESLWVLHRGLQLILINSEKELDVFFRNHKGFKMDFGLFFFGTYTSEKTSVTNYQWLLDTVKSADRKNFSSVWTPERHFDSFGGLFPNPSVLSAAMAATTDQIQIRCGSIVSPLHHSVRIAEDWSLIDNLSKGRVGVSFASGWQCNDFIFFPDRYRGRHQFMLQQIQEVRHLWEGGSLSLQNGLGQSVDTEIYPKPVQKTLPIWVTVSGKTETFVDAGKIGAHILTHLLWQDSSQLVEKIAAYRKSLQENGYDPMKFKVTVMVHTFIGEDDEAVREIVKEPLKSYIKSSVGLIETMSGSRKSEEDKAQIGRYGGIEEKIPEKHLEELLNLAFDRFFDHAGLLGSAERCHQFLKKLKAFDVDEVACLIDFGVSLKDVDQSLELLSKFKKDYEKPALFGGQSIVVRLGKDKEMLKTLKSLKTNLAGKLVLAIVQDEGRFESSGIGIIKLSYLTDKSNKNKLCIDSLSTRNKVDALSEVIDEEF